jgi:hypothetical protein
LLLGDGAPTSRQITEGVPFRFTANAFRKRSPVEHAGARPRVRDDRSGPSFNVELIGVCTMERPLLDPAYVPTDVGSPHHVAELNRLVEKLRSRLVDRVEMQEPGTGFRVSNMARVYTQTHLRRCLQLIEAAHHLVYSGYGLAAITLVRSVYETVANYVAVSQQLVDLIEANTPLNQSMISYTHARTRRA